VREHGQDSPVRGVRVEAELQEDLPDVGFDCLRRDEENGYEPAARRTQNPRVSDGLSGMKPLSLAQELRLAFLAEHAIRLEHGASPSSASAVRRGSFPPVAAGLQDGCARLHLLP